MINEIQLGRKKIYVIVENETVFLLVDCNATGGMMRIPMNLNQFERWQSPARGLIQDIFPMMKKELREVLVSGQTPAEWNETFGEKPYTTNQLKKEFNYEFE